MTIQLPLPRPDPFVPLRHGVAHYVPVLPNRLGELQALQQASEDVWNRLTPTIRIVGPRKRRDPLRGETVRSWIKKIHIALSDRLLFLDTMRPGPTFPVATAAGNAPLLSFLYEQARRRGMEFVPVVHVGTKHEVAQAQIVAEAVLRDQRGVALHLPADLALPSDTTFKEYLTSSLARVQSEVSTADLWIDFAYLDPDVDIDPKDVAELVNELADIGDWRSIVLSGTTMPPMLGGYVETGTVGSIDRREWMLWGELEANGVDRMPTFSDYAIQHPHPPHEGGGPGMRANIRYTVEQRVIIARGVEPVVQVGNIEYPWLCQEIAGSREFLGADYTWGDRVIDDCARGAMEPGSQNLWRGAGTSHHLRFVTDQLLRQARS